MAIRLYHFTEAQHALTSIALHRLKIAQVTQLNDPYELSAIYVKDPEQRGLRQLLVSEFDGKQGIICFSRDYQSPVMWAHYAKNHTGICLGFDVDEDIAIEVKYIKDLLRFEKDRPPTLANALDIISSKYVSWEYEKEYRIFASLDSETIEHGNYFLDFSNSVRLREVVIGCRCEISTSAIRELVKSFDYPVYVIKTRLAFTDFKVVEDRNFRAPSGI